MYECFERDEHCDASCKCENCQNYPGSAELEAARAKQARIDAAEEPLEELMRATFEHIEQEVDAIVHTKFSAGKLVLIGGIQLNIGKPFADHFLPLSFRVLWSVTQVHP